jgi:hypothetical protein
MNVRLSYITGGSIRILTITFMFLFCDSDKPLSVRELRNVITYCCRNNQQIIIGCDANAHIILASTNMNPTEQYLMEYLMSTNLYILNKDNESTTRQLTIGRRLQT